MSAFSDPTPVDSAPAGETDVRAASGPKRGGGPPGGSAFNRGGRLRRISARPAAAPAPTPTPTPTPAPAPSAFLPDDAPSNDTAAFTGEPWHDETTARPTSKAGSRGSTGYASLPRLNATEAESSVQFVGTAFVRAQAESPVNETHCGFDEYFTFQSLFEEPTDPNLAGAPTDDPYELLGIEPSATWDEIVAVKRQLVKQHHPDHLSDATPEERSAAEERLRLINWAYTQVRADHGR